jgi:hypothetical protein
MDTRCTVSVNNPTGFFIDFDILGPVSDIARQDDPALTEHEPFLSKGPAFFIHDEVQTGRPAALPVLIGIVEGRAMELILYSMKDPGDPGT